jgi:hypothetical protein
VKFQRFCVIKWLPRGREPKKKMERRGRKLNLLERSKDDANYGK